MRGPKVKNNHLEEKIIQDMKVNEEKKTTQESNLIKGDHQPIIDNSI